jgi:glycosyltransferase involved in cell wall biosynthesis
LDRSVRVAFVVPAYQAEPTVGAVVRALFAIARGAELTTDPALVVVDDGSRDATGEEARRAGAPVITHERNRGKGAALLAAFQWAAERGARAAVSVDADGQHPAEEALALALAPAPPEALVLGVRDLVRDGAPRASRFSNAFSNTWLSWFARQRLGDTQCGLRRYPLPETLELGARGRDYDFESEVVLRAARAGLPIAEQAVRVIYPAHAERRSSFRALRDPARITLRLVLTALSTPWSPPRPR